MTSLLSTLVLAATLGAGGDAAVTTLDGRVVKGALAAWDGKEISLATAEGDVAFPTAELLDVRWDKAVVEAPAALRAELIDGARFSYADFTLGPETATFTGGRFERPLQVPREALRLVELQPARPAIAAALEEVARKDAAGDALIVAKRDGESMDYLTGVVGEVTAEQATFEWDGERIPVKRSKIAAIVFYQPSPARLPEAVCELSLADGSRIVAHEAALKGDRVTVTTPAGVDFDFPLTDVVRADFSAGKIAYLSDLKPSEVHWTPRVGAPSGASTLAAHGLPRSDLSFSGSPLSLLWKDDVARSRRDIRTYAKGLAIRSRTELTFRLPEGVRRFVAVAGIDPVSAGQGHVTLQIRDDSRVLWEGVVDGKQPPVEIDVELHSARRLHVVVDYGENLDFGDRLHLVEARVTK